MTVALSIEHVSKIYRLGQIGTGTLSRDLEVWWANVRGKPNPLLRIGEAEQATRGRDELWALRDVSFQVQQGDALGIIGRNGAGKSTLLKILSRVTAPTSGKVKVKGRIASLLEVGTGFHPELTGRENIYLNGVILGMSRREVARKFNEIVDFAEVEKFVDTPVKRYSSGMFVRLAFAVAAHLDPEILVIDEVLAVGDLAFQKKCLGKMGDVTKAGRTVLFVSHNMGAINQLCPKAVLLRHGVVVMMGDTQQVINEYLQGQESGLDEAHLDVKGSGKITSIRVEDSQGVSRTDFGVGEDFVVKFTADVPDYVRKTVAGLEVSSLDGQKLLNLRSDGQGVIFESAQRLGSTMFSVKIPGLPLYPGVYSVEPWYAEYRGKRIDHVFNAIKISIYPKGKFESEKFIQPGRGVMLVDCEWGCEHGEK